MSKDFPGMIEGAEEIDVSGGRRRRLAYRHEIRVWRFRIRWGRHWVIR